MFVHAVKATKGGAKGYYCTVVTSVRKPGSTSPSHETVMKLGFVGEDRLPYVKAAFGDGDPAEILRRELSKQNGGGGDNGD